MLALPNIDYVLLLSKGTFHQVHGGVATNAPLDRHPWTEFSAEFKRIRGRDFGRVPRRPIMFGCIRPEAQHIVAASWTAGSEWWQEQLEQQALKR